MPNFSQIGSEELNSQIFLPQSLSTIESQPITAEVVSSNEALLKQISNCNQDQFSGYLTLTVPGKQIQTWNLYFLNGWLVGGTGGAHAVRRWERQIARYCPQLNQPKSSLQSMESPQPWDYASLAQQIDQGNLSASHLVAVMRGNLIEMLFDCMQAYHACDRPLGIQLSYHDFCQSVTASPPALVQPSHVLRQAIQAWNAWHQADLGKYSPNLAPVIQNPEALQQQTSPSAYQNLTKAVNGNLTFRDLAIKLKSHLILLTRSIMPYVTQEIIRLQTIPDIVCAAPPAKVIPVQPQQPQSTGPLVAYLEDSRFDCMAMGQILKRAGYRFISIRDPIQALPMLLEHKPKLVFLDVLMPVLNGYEVCAQIRQISTFKTTPVIMVTSSDGIVDRVRAKLIGSTDFLAKPITSEKVLATLQNHLPIPSTTSAPYPQISPSHQNVSRKRGLGARNVI